MKTEDLLSLAEMVEFKKYLKDCLSCDYDTMDEAQRHKAYELWQDSIKPEEDQDIKEYNKPKGKEIKKRRLLL